MASRLSKVQEEYECAVFLACIGEDTQEVCDGLDFIEEEDYSDVVIVMLKLETICIGTTNEVFESYCFTLGFKNKESQLTNT